VVCCVVLQH